MSTAIIYGSIPHYRKGIVEALKASAAAYTFVGSSVETDGVRNYDFGAGDDFVDVTNIKIGKFLIQPRVILQSCCGAYRVCVFLANSNHLSTWVGALIYRIRGHRVIF